MAAYTVENLLTLLRNPRSLVGLIRGVGLKINVWYHRHSRRNDGILVADEPWDTLVILDGCRYDLFAATNDLDGDLRSVISRGSTSVEFLEENFKGRQYHDTVYVSANPYMHKLPPDTFHEIYDLTIDEWDSSAETVLPARVVERSLETHRQHPDKRLIVHFMQPHYPFIGELGERIEHRGFLNKQYHEHDHRTKYTVWGKLQYELDGLTESEVWAAYRENLEIVLDHVETLVAGLDGKTVITADHGNLVGERLSPIPVKGYAHPGGLRVDELVRVPWFELPFDERRETVAEPPVERAPRPTADEEKLEALGYVT